MSMSSGAEIEVVRRLLRIVLLLLFASSALSARLSRKSSPSLYDYITIGERSQSSDLTHSLNDSTPTGKPAVPSVSLFQTTNPPPSPSASASCSCSSSAVSAVSGNASSSCSCSSSSSSSISTSFNQSSNLTTFSSSISTSFNQSSNLTIGQAASPSYSPTITHHSDFPPTLPRSPTRASRGGLNLLEKIGIATAVMVVSLAILIAVFKAFKKAFHNDTGNDSRAGNIDILKQTAGQHGNPLEVGIIDIRTHPVEDLSCLEEGIGIRTYTREEIADATDNFRTEVGQGVSGSVYRANLPGNRIGAVKRATNLDPYLFKGELSVLLRLPRHPHLVDLIGLCVQAGERILVFEFISRGSLYDRLHKNNKGTLTTDPLSWASRMDIAFQVALALQYLHEEAKPPILHRDIKSANILLEDDNSAKLADFGLSKLGPKNDQFTITAVRGSYGYMDPQYVKTGRYSAKSDVYSFGVLLLELITGFKSLHEDTPLAEWSETYRSEGTERFMRIIDRNVIEHINMMEVHIMIKIANLCLRDISEERPSMREIVNMIQETRNMGANEKLSSNGGESPLLGNENLSSGGQCCIAVD